MLIDFGLVAAIGNRAPVGFTPSYAAPEAAAAHKIKAHDMSVGTELDAWSLGVIALEMVLRKPVFGNSATFDEVWMSSESPPGTCHFYCLSVGLFTRFVF